MEERLNAMDASFDVSSSQEQDDDTHAFVPSRYLHDEALDPAKLLETEDSNHKRFETLRFALEQLDERSQDILKKRWLRDEKAVTLHELADEYGVSAERIRQLEKNAMKKLRAHIETQH